MVVKKDGTPFQAVPTLSVWVLPFLLTHFLAPCTFRLLLTRAGVLGAPRSLSWRVPPLLLEVLSLFQILLDILSDFSHRGNTPLPFSHITLLQNVRSSCDPMACWAEVSCRVLQATHIWDPGLFPSLEQGDHRRLGGWTWGLNTETLDVRAFPSFWHSCFSSNSAMRPSQLL